MSLIYTEEIIANPDGILCRVLDTARLDFSGAVEGRKTAMTLVRCADGGERIETMNSEKKVEAVYTAQRGDAIFINLHNRHDMYIPGDADGSRWQFREVAGKGYEIVGKDQQGGGILVRSRETSGLLHECIRQPTCIKNAWGEGHHQFLFPGATLKKGNNGRVTGIDKEAFDATWEIIASSVTPCQKNLPDIKRG